jgi:hypothetical protein
MGKTTHIVFLCFLVLGLQGCGFYDFTLLDSGMTSETEVNLFKNSTFTYSNADTLIRGTWQGIIHNGDTVTLLFSDSSKRFYIVAEDWLINPEVAPMAD